MSASISAELRSQVYDRDEGRCAYCQTPEQLTIVTFEVDHIVPISAGGETTLDNLCLACPACNRNKGARQIAPDPETGKLVPLFNPRQQVWSSHFKWSEDAVRIIGRTPIGRATVEALRMNRPQMIRLRTIWKKLGYWPG